ncbi:anhydro-N-acetylmuramic acid kinase [Rhodohalobacter barkolensis]|uniref:Anhydro-N-acetylmuramic acid kinase n=1 Tax=Rhodohalobacter barkolensis TaxID=2053187 RepID=A0A2N0VF75_9BACT|nr:anhydro-N-acetylmuramic acid kinase [Rhodohalobacter barkolensis]PKD42798.1 anhydro-N-acetylmuramic acid kinase [Rhodohalobacter barkolensis]
MNPSIKKLVRIAEKESRLVIGLMSGTSLDGLDIALCEIEGSGPETEVSLLKFVTKPYHKNDRDKLRKVTSVDQVSLKDLCYVHTWLGQLHADMIIESLFEWDIKPEKVDCIGSHGQTIYHLPNRDLNGEETPMNSTLQIGDGDHIAVNTGIITISDFRQKHTAFGGEGAPMAPLVDDWLFGDKKEHRILLNIGGIANYTFMPAAEVKDLKKFSTDTGPGNTLIDAVVKSRFDKPFDKGGKIAASGNVIKPLLNKMLEDEWFRSSEEKSTGPEYFNLKWIKRKEELAGFSGSDISERDMVATVTELTAKTIAQNIQHHLPEKLPVTVYPSGGGAHNRFLMERISNYLDQVEVRSFAELGFSPDAKEAVIFAVLANETVAGYGFNIQTKYGSDQNIHFGKVSFPA